MPRFAFHGLLLLVALAASSFAADPPKAEEVKRNATVERVKLVGVSAMLEQEAIRKDIGLTKDQEEKVSVARAEMEKKLKALSDASKAALQETNVEVADLQRQTEMVTDCVFEIDGTIQKLLTATQVYRLKQIQLQREGPNALLGRFAVRELALTPEQEDKIVEAVKKLNKPKASDFAAVTAIAPEEPRIAKYLNTRSTELDTIRDEAVKHLTADQKAKWKEMVGEELPTICLLVSSPEGHLIRLLYKMATK